VLEGQRKRESERKNTLGEERERDYLTVFRWKSGAFCTSRKRNEKAEPKRGTCGRSGITLLRRASKSSLVQRGRRLTRE